MEMKLYSKEHKTDRKEGRDAGSMDRGMITPSWWQGPCADRPGGVGSGGNEASRSDLRIHLISQGVSVARIYVAKLPHVKVFSEDLKIKANQAVILLDYFLIDGVCLGHHSFSAVWFNHDSHNAAHIHQLLLTPPHPNSPLLRHREAQQTCQNLIGQLHVQGKIVKVFIRKVFVCHVVLWDLLLNRGVKEVLYFTTQDLDVGRPQQKHPKSANHLPLQLQLHPRPEEGAAEFSLLGLREPFRKNRIAQVPQTTCSSCLFLQPLHAGFQPGKRHQDVPGGLQPGL
ncbi:hypothetical protein FQN60_017616, partial [Etheostoma spectabile]